jgi:serine/threonine-protein kinase
VSQPQLDSEAPTTAVRVPRRFTLERPPHPAEIVPLLRRRLMLIAMLMAGTTTFFASYRFLIPSQWAFFRSTTVGTALLAFEASLCVTSIVVALVLWRRQSWRLRTLRKMEFGFVAYIAVYVAWSQLHSWAGSRFTTGSGVATIDPFLLRQAIDSMAVRWMALIVGVSTLIPETPRRNAALVGILAVVALALTGALGIIDPAYTPHLGVMLAVMAFWMTLASTIGIFGSYKLAELRQQVQDARELGQYRLIRRIGAGNMGEVHLAEHLLLRQPCAIKLIRPDRAADAATLARFEQEVQATSQLSHWNTVRIYDYGYTDEGTFYYVMEYLPGWTLQALVQEQGPLPPARVIHLLRQVCAALREAHAMGLVHRDIKPANIVICRRGGVADLVKLLDFGLVRRADAREALITAPGMLAGTPAYMSPEQASGESGLDACSDLYSLGAVGYYLATGQPPFVRATSMHTLIAHVKEAPQPPQDVQPGVPADLGAVLLRCLAKNPRDRFQDAASVDAALRACTAAGQWTDVHAEEWWRTRPAPRHDTVAVEWT